jgi:peptidoglycan hydrolase CwlO-like protein
MCKKAVYVALGVVAVLAVLSYTKLGSYAGTAWGKIRHSASNQVPIEFEIDRLKNEVAQLIPDMKKNRSQVAEEMVAIDNLKEEIAATRTRLDEQKVVLMKLSKDVDSGETMFIYNGVTYKRERILEKLSRDFDSFKRAEAELASKQQLLEAKERALDAAKQQLAAMRDQKHDLEVQIAQLEAEVKTVRLAQTKCKFQVDDSRLAEIKKSLSELRTRLKAEKYASEMEGEFANDAIPVTVKVRPAADVTREVREYLEGNKADSKVAIERK